MPLEVFTANDIDYTISADGSAPAGQRMSALVKAQLIDEITGTAPLDAIDITSPFPGMSKRIGEDGMLGLAGIPARVFSELSGHLYTFPVTLSAEGYLPLFRTVSLGPTAAFPDVFAPADLGTLSLHRAPTVIAGCVAVDSGTDMQGIVGASVTVTGIWRTPPAASVVVPPDQPNLLSLVPGMYFDRSHLTGQVQGLAFLGLPGPDKQLLQDAAAGTVTVRLSDRQLIAAADVLAIDTADGERTEYISIHAVVGGSTPDQAATVTLDAPLRAIHRAGATVHKVVFQNMGAATPLTDDAIPGDVCLFVNNVGSLASAPFCSVQGGGPVAEYHAAQYFTTTTVTDGFYRWPAMSRVAQCALIVHDGVHPDLDITYAPEYPSAVSRLDLVYH